MLITLVGWGTGYQETFGTAAWSGKYQTSKMEKISKRIKTVLHNVPVRHYLLVYPICVMFQVLVSNISDVFSNPALIFASEQVQQISSNHVFYVNLIVLVLS